MLSDFTWIHLSDLHVVAADDPEQKRAWKALCEDIALFRHGDDAMGFSAAGRCPDAIFVTGDLTYSGLLEEFRALDEFLGRLAIAAGITRDKIRVVAGNHDVERAKVELDQSVEVVRARGDAELRKSVDRLWTAPCRVSSIGNKMNGYLVFARSFPPEQLGPYGSWIEEFRRGARRYVIIGLNSSWLCGSDETDRPGVPLVGGYQRELFDAVLTDVNATVCFVLQHHPVEWMNSLDGRAHAAWLMRMGAICLTGHLHVADIRHVDNLDGSYLQISGGSGFQGYRGLRRYSWGRIIDTPGTKLELAFRKMSEDGNVPRYVADGDICNAAPKGLFRCVRGKYKGNGWRTIRREDEWGFDSIRDVVDPQEVRVLCDSVAIEYDEGKYRICFRKTLRNETNNVLERFYARVAVNAFPDSPESSRRYYRGHPVDLDEIGFYARSDGAKMTWEIIHDDDSNKELFLLFANEDARFPIYQGCEASIEYGFNIGADQWGPFIQRAVRLPTDILRCRISFPVDVAVSVWGIERSFYRDNMPIEPPVQVVENALRRIVTWELERPKVHNRYRLCWRFG